MPPAVPAIRSKRKVSTGLPLKSEDGVVPPRERTLTAVSCDQCRRKKTKCDGKKSCQTCVRLSLECSYGKTAKQLGGPTYVAYLEKAVKRLSTQVEPTSASEDEWSFGSRVKADSEAETLTSISTLGSPDFVIPPLESDSARRYGCCSGLEILRRIRLHLDIVAGLLPQPVLIDALTRSLDRPFPSERSLPPVLHPTRDDLLHFTRIALNWDEAFGVPLFVDKDEIVKSLRHIRGLESLAPVEDDHIAFSLVFALAAFGACIDRAGHTTIDAIGQVVDWRGTAYFRIARGLVRSSELELSFTALQTNVCLALYLVTGSAVTTAHTYITTAAAIALRLGLHVLPVTHKPVERMQMYRQRTYQLLKTLDTYVATFLGIPCCLPPLDEALLLKHSMHAGLHDMSITHERHADVATCHTPLAILDRARQAAYFDGQNINADNVYDVPSRVIEQFNGNFGRWQRLVSGVDQGWPMATLKEDTNGVPMFSRHQSLLNGAEADFLVLLTFAYARMMANSPFLHYLQAPVAIRDDTGAKAGAICAEAAIETIQLLKSFQHRLLTSGFQPFIFCLTFATHILLFLEMSAVEIPDIGGIGTAGHDAEDLLQQLALYHSTALGSYTSLEALFQAKRARTQLVDARELSNPLFLQPGQDMHTSLSGHPVLLESPTCITSLPSAALFPQALTATLRGPD